MKMMKNSFHFLEFLKWNILNVKINPKTLQREEIFDPE